MEYLITKEQFQIAQQSWKQNKSHSAGDHIIYNLLRSKPIDKGFSERKSNIQAYDPWRGFNNGLIEARWMTQRYPDKFKEKFGIDIPDNFLERMKR